METKKKARTIDLFKSNHRIPDEAKLMTKEFIKIKKIILKSLESEQKTIPQIAKETDIPSHIITKNLMTLIKYGNIKAGKPDDLDEYYYYEFLKK